MSEHNTAARIMRALRSHPSLDPVRVENAVAHPGTPDINYIGGWIECKHMTKWPRTADSKPVGYCFDAHHFTLQQRIWLKRRVRLGGRAHLVLQVGREWLVFRGDAAADELGRIARPRMIEIAVGRWADGLVDEEFRRCLSGSGSLSLPASGS